jgi:hypothetical protein
MALREPNWTVRGRTREGEWRVVYSGPSEDQAGRSKAQAEASRAYATVVALKGYLYPPPERQPGCLCLGSPVAPMVCPFGHMTECHYPERCAAALCAHRASDPGPDLDLSAAEEAAAWLGMRIRPDDTFWESGPEPGDADCLCSRCGAAIADGVVPIYFWPEEGGGEYRFHPECLGLVVAPEPEWDPEEDVP